MPNRKSVNLLCSETDRKHIIAERAAVVLAGGFPLRKADNLCRRHSGRERLPNGQTPRVLCHTVTFELPNTINLNDFASAIFFTLPFDNPS
jgi:hypothetical protein